MAFKDGMKAIAKVARVAGGAGAALCVIASLITAFSDGSPVALLTGILLAFAILALFWTPAWVIEKFIE